MDVKNLVKGGKFVLVEVFVLWLINVDYESVGFLVFFGLFNFIKVLVFVVNLEKVFRYLVL